MKNEFLICLVLSGYMAAAQSSFDLKDLKTPTAPGFVLMDETPESIDKPTTPTALAVSVLNLGRGGAVQFAPYWLKAHPELNYEEYAKNRFPIWHSLGFSVGSQVKNDSSFLGLGLKTNIFRWRSKDAQHDMQLIEDSIKQILNRDIDATAVSQLKKLRTKLIDLIDQPTLIVSAAFSWLGVGDNEKFKNLKGSRFGTWLNVTYKNQSLPNTNFICLVRYLKNPNFSGYETNSEFIDVGASVAYKKNRFGLSGEYVRRTALAKSNSFDRISGLLEYKLIDNLFLTGSVGKNFDQEKDLFVLFGVNVGISKEAKIKF
jgi:hypothetical protein